MAKIKRKSRNKMSKNHDILKPITIEMLGTEDDPCFGKHQDPRTPECSRCGDAEICAIVMAQNTAIKRAQIESKQKFKDLEPEKLADKKVVRKMVRKRVFELAKLKSKGYPLQGVIDDIHSTYVMHGWTKKKIKNLIDNMVENSSKLSIKDNHIKFHKQ